MFMKCTNHWRLFILVSVYLLPFFSLASHNDQQKPRYSKKQHGGNRPAKRARIGGYGFLEKLKYCFIREDIDCSRNLLQRAMYVPLKAIPFIRNLHQLEQLLEYFPDISPAALNQQDQNTGRSALMNCCIHGAYSAAALLVQRNVAVNGRDALGNTALMLLTTNGQAWNLMAEGLGLFRMLLVRSNLTLSNNVGQCFLDIYPLSPTDIMFALSTTLRRNDAHQADQLLSLEAAKNVSFAFVPLIRSLSMAQVVFAHGGDQVLPHVTALHPITKLNILHSAVMMKDYAFVKYLLTTYKCPIEAQESSRGYSAVSIALYLLPRTGDDSEIEALNRIIFCLFKVAGDRLSDLCQQEPIEALMVRAGESLWPKCIDQYAFLVNWESWAINRMKQDFASYPNIKTDLLALGFDASFTNGLSKQNMNKILKRALDADALNSYRFLLHYGAPTDGILPHVRTPMQVSVLIQYIRPDTLDKLLELRDAAGFTQFHHAVINADYDMVQLYLLMFCADPNHVDELGRHSLMIALESTRSHPPHTYDKIIQLLAPYSDTSLEDTLGRSVFDILDQRVVYKKLDTATSMAVYERQNLGPLDARQLTYY